MALTAGQRLPEYRVRAHNGAAQSENKIHDDAVARQYGFAGGLVPGVTVHAYMTRPAVDAFGRDWVERGTMSTRFLRPFYEGEVVTVRATVSSVDGETVSIELQALNEAGELCGAGSATLPSAAAAQPSVRDFPEAPLPPQRPLVSEDVLGAIDILGSIAQSWERIAENAAFLDEIVDDHALWRGPDAIVHPGYLIRDANAILVRNVQLGPWIHVSSDVTHFSALPHGEGFSTRGRVVDLFEKKGHRFVALDVLMVADSGRPLMRVAHTAIYDVRKVADS